MKAYLCKEFGPIASHKIESIDIPTPGDNDVLIEVYAAGVAFPDVLVVQGLYQIKPEFPFSPGGEFTGLIKDVGSKVKGWKPGDRVIGFKGSGGFAEYTIIYPYWRLIYFLFSAVTIGLVFAFLQFTTFGMVVRAGMADRETVGLLGINIDRRFTLMFGIAAAVAGLAGVMYTPINPPNYHMGMDFLVLSFVVVVVGGMGSLPGAVLAGFLLGILESFASMNEVKTLLPGIDQIIIYLVAIAILLTRPRGLMGRAGVMED